MMNTPDDEQPNLDCYLQSIENPPNNVDQQPDTQMNAQNITVNIPMNV
jgi:hypothetical protein